MNTMNNPFANQIHQAGEQFLASQRQMLDWQRSQMKLVEEAAMASFKLGRAGFDVSAEMGQGMARTMVDGLAPRKENPAA